MKLCRLRIVNYRSIKSLELEVPDMLVLVGPNNHGKSNILRAIEFGLSTAAKPDRDDFFRYGSEVSKEMWVEMTFRALTQQEKKTFEKYLRADETICIRKSARLQDDGTVTVEYKGYVQEPDLWWLQESAWERLSTRDKIENEAQDVPELRSLLEREGKVTRNVLQDFQRQYIDRHRNELNFVETLEEGPLLGQKNVGGGVLPDFFLVPAVRDLTEELKVRSTTTFGRLLQHALKEMAECEDGFGKACEEIRAAVEKLKTRPSEKAPANPSALQRLESMLTDELAPWGVRVSISVVPPDLERIFELGAQLHIDDGLMTLAERKGHGIQRAVLFGLIRAWAKTIRAGREPTQTVPRRSSESVFFAIEEPELFLHPQAQRQLARDLSEIGESADHQVFISTHSTHFVDLDHYRRLAIVSRADPRRGTTIRQCTKELFSGPDGVDRKKRFHMASWINPDRGELFFAQKVVLVEGETERVLIPFLARKLQCFDPNVSVIDCGGKNNLPLYMEVLNAFRIPYCVIHDEDGPVVTTPNDQSVGGQAGSVDVKRTNESIHALVDIDLGIVEMLSPDFETVAGIAKGGGGRKGKALAALDYFGSMGAGALPERIVEVVQSAYRIRCSGASGNE